MNWKRLYDCVVVTEVSCSKIRVSHSCVFFSFFYHSMRVLLLLLFCAHIRMFALITPPFLVSSLAVLHVKLSVRTPLSGPELILSEEKQLSVGDWPSLIHETVEDCPIQHTTTPLARNNNEEDQNSSSNLKRTGKTLEPQHTPRTTSGGPDYSILTEQEKCTPFAPEVCSFLCDLLLCVYSQPLLCIFCCL